MATGRESGAPAGAPIPREELARIIREALKKRPVSNEDENNIGEEFTPATRWRAARWWLGGLSSAGLAIFGIGVAYSGNATKSDLGEHRATDFVPLRAEVAAFKQELGPIKAGVQMLVDDRNLQREVKRARRKLHRYNASFTEDLQEHRKNRRAGRRAGRRPRKTADHLDLEQLVQDLEEQI